MKHQLYGDGIHDDYPAIQEMIDSGACEVTLPVPKVCYLISKTLTLPSNFRLVLPRFAKIRLMDGANCFMLTNKMTEKYCFREDNLSHELFFFYDVYSNDPEDRVRNIEVKGGIWDFNNLGQNPNPLQTGKFEPTHYTGIGMLFYNVKGLKLTEMTLKDPVNFAVTLDTVSYFTVEDITFDFNYGNPNALNMDGIHLDGNCHYGVIRNLKGACYDDLIALNADEGSNGPITNIEIDGIFAEDCHSAVRLLTVKNPVEKITISNVYGTYYQYVVGFTRFHNYDGEGYFDAITLDKIYASKAVRHSVYCKEGMYVFPIIFMEAGVYLKNVKVSNLHRREENTSVYTIGLKKDVKTEQLILDNVTTENGTGEQMPLLRLYPTSHIGTLTLRNVTTDGDPRIVNEGTIGTLRDEDVCG